MTTKNTFHESRKALYGLYIDSVNNVAFTINLANENFSTNIETSKLIVKEIEDLLLDVNLKFKELINLVKENVE